VKLTRSAGGILAIVFLATALRLIYLHQWAHSDFYSCPILDQMEFLDESGLVADHGLAGLGIVWRPPLYPLAVGTIFRLAHGSRMAALILQTLLSGLCAGLVYLIAVRFASKAVSLAAAALYAVHWIMIFSSVLFLTTTLFTFLVLLTTWLLLASGGRRMLLLLAGISAGLAALARSEIVVCIPFWAAWAFWQNRGTPLARTVNPAVFVLAAAVTISPITIQNYRLTRSFVPITAIGGYNLFVGNNAQSDGKTVWASEKALTDLNISPDLPPLENQRRYVAAATGYIKSNPAQFLKLVVKKAYYLVNSFEISDNVDVYYAISATSLLLAVLAGVSFGLLLPLALVGVVFGRYDRRSAVPVHLFLVTFTAVLLLFFVNSRFRTPLIPFLCVFAVLGAETLWKERKTIFRRPAVIAFLAFFLLLSNSRLFNVANPRDTVEMNLRQAHAFFYQQKYESCRNMLGYILTVAPDSQTARALCAKLPDGATSRFEPGRPGQQSDTKQ